MMLRAALHRRKRVKKERGSRAPEERASRWRAVV
jgi:hypothetical protein